MLRDQPLLTGMNDYDKLFGNKNLFDLGTANLEIFKISFF